MQGLKPAGYQAPFGYGSGVVNVRHPRLLGVHQLLQVLRHVGGGHRHGADLHLHRLAGFGWTKIF